MPASPSKRRRPLPCRWCIESFKTIQGFRVHIRKHQRSQRDPVSPLRNKLLSRRSNVNDDNGVFEFDDILGAVEIATCTEIVSEPDDDSYYSDYAYDCEYEGNNDLSSSSDESDNGDSSDDDMSDATFDLSSDEDDEDNVMDYVDTDGEESNPNMTTTTT